MFNTSVSRIELADSIWLICSKILETPIHNTKTKHVINVYHYTTYKVYIAPPKRSRKLCASMMVVR